MVFGKAPPVIGDYHKKLERDKCFLWAHDSQFNVAPHGHAFLELSYICSGTVEHTLDGKTELLTAGDYLIVDYGSCHSYRNRGETAFSNVDCLFLPELLDPALKGTRTLRAVLEHYLLHFNMQSLIQNPARMIFHDGNGRVWELIERIREELEERRAGFAELVRCYLVEILLLTVRRLEGAQSAMAGQEISSRISACVAERFRENLTLRALAEELNYSLPYLSKRFKAETGMGFARFLQNYRVMQACRMLSATTLSFGEITEAVGYRDTKSFAALFKKEMGVSPMAFRRSRRQTT